MTAENSLNDTDIECPSATALPPITSNEEWSPSTTINQGEEYSQLSLFVLIT